MKLGFEIRRSWGDLKVLNFIIIQREGAYERAHSRNLSRDANRWLVSHLSSGTKY